MKKFLTMLLALSVVFTYTVGTAFAAAPADYSKFDQDVEKAASTILSELDKAKAGAVAKLDANGKAFSFGAPSGTLSGSIKVSKADLEKVADAIYNDYVRVLAIAKANVKANADTYGDKTVDELVTALNEITVNGTTDKAADLNGYKLSDLARTDVAFKNAVEADGKTFKDGKYEIKAEEYGVNAYKAATLEKIEKIDLALYADVVMTDADFGADNLFNVTYLQKATEDKAQFAKDVEAVKADYKATDLYDTKESAVRKAVVGVLTVEQKLVKGESKQGLDGEVILSYAIKDLKTKETMDSEDATLEAQKAAKKAQVQANVADYMKDAKADTKDTMQVKADAYVKLQYNVIDNYNVIRVKPISDSLYVKAVEKVGLYEAEIAKLKLVKDINGELKYDAAKLDEIFKSIEKSIYRCSVADDLKVEDDLKEVDARFVTKNASMEITGIDYSYALNKSDDLEYAMKAKIAKIEDAKEKALVNDADKTDKYYDLEKAKVVAEYDAAIEAVKAAKDMDQLNYIYNLYMTASTGKVDTALAKINTKGNVDKEIAKTAAYKAAYTDTVTTPEGKLEVYLKDVVNKDYGINDANYRVYDWAELASFYAEKGARTDAEVKALFEDAKAMLAALPTNGEKYQAKVNADALVKALPNYITLADKEQIVAAYDAYIEAYGKTTFANLPVRLQNAINMPKVGVQVLEEKAIDDMVAKLPVAKVTSADKEAVKAIIDAMKAFNDTEMYTKDYTKVTVKAYEDALKDAELLALNNMINSLSKDSTRAEVEAARTAYDAFVEEYTDLVNDIDVRNAVDVDKLLDVEAIIDAADIAAVEGVKVTASSKAYKGAIRVNWTVKGDKDAVDGYEVFRSVYKNKGFGTKAYFKTTKTTYKNTKALKKGKRYYYKVRAYKVVDGKKYYSDWSNKAYRIAK